MFSNCVLLLICIAHVQKCKYKINDPWEETYTVHISSKKNIVILCKTILFYSVFLTMWVSFLFPLPGYMSCSSKIMFWFIDKACVINVEKARWNATEDFFYSSLLPDFFYPFRSFSSLLSTIFLSIPFIFPCYTLGYVTAEQCWKYPSG